jgi:AraC-like DNA-binding protein
LRGRDPILRGVLERHALEMLARLPSTSGTGLEVRRALATRVVGGDTRIGTIARALAMSTRSLQRKLEAEGSSYQALVDESKRDAAERYLSDSALPIGEVAYLLGYSEPAAFHRAFKRWTRMTPHTFRQSRAGAAERGPRRAD